MDAAVELSPAEAGDSNADHLEAVKLYLHQKRVNPMSFVMYSTTWCGYCKRLKSQLADLGVTFEEINIEEVPGTAEIVEKVNGGNRTVPTLVFSDGAVMTNPSAKQVTEKLAELGL